MVQAIHIYTIGFPTCLRGYVMILAKFMQDFGWDHLNRKAKFIGVVEVEYVVTRMGIRFKDIHFST